MENQSKKMNINKDTQELRLYMYTIQSGPIKIDLPEDFRVIMAYNDTDAINMMRREYSAGIALNVKKRAQIDVRKIIDAVNIQLTAPQEMKLIVAPPEPRQKTIGDFVYGLMLISDKYVKSKKDKVALSGIIKRIKINENEKNN